MGKGGLAHNQDVRKLLTSPMQREQLVPRSWAGACQQAQAGMARRVWGSAVSGGAPWELLQRLELSPREEAEPTPGELEQRGDAS